MNTMNTGETVKRMVWGDHIRVERFDGDAIEVSIIKEGESLVIFKSVLRKHEALTYGPMRAGVECTITPA